MYSSRLVFSDSVQARRGRSVGLHLVAGKSSADRDLAQSRIRSERSKMINMVKVRCVGKRREGWGIVKVGFRGWDGYFARVLEPLPL
jgi:hypothetical protein